jgi:hypothetical protein
MSSFTSSSFVANTRRLGNNPIHTQNKRMPAARYKDLMDVSSYTKNALTSSLRLSQLYEEHDKKILLRKKKYGM